MPLMMLYYAAAPAVGTAPPTTLAPPSGPSCSLAIMLLVHTPATFTFVVDASLLPLPSLIPGYSVPSFDTLSIPYSL
jgi:hypothetical protein